MFYTPFLHLSRKPVHRVVAHEVLGPFSRYIGRRKRATQFPFNKSLLPDYKLTTTHKIGQVYKVPPCFHTV